MRKTNGGTSRGKLGTVLRLRHAKKWLPNFDECVVWMMGYGVVMGMVTAMVMGFHLGRWEYYISRSLSFVVFPLSWDVYMGTVGVFVVYTI